ncbi:hypothetical protein IKL64_08375 [bacterium]|nr:hypothetical protein [bacterium]
MGGINFNGNSYGINKQEFKAFKQELKKADKANDNFDLSKADYKEIEAAIVKGDLSAYLDRAGAELKVAMGIALTGKVDGTEDLDAARQIVNNAEFDVRPDGKPTDKAKVIQYIINANPQRVEQNLASDLGDVFPALQLLGNPHYFGGEKPTVAQTEANIAALFENLPGLV